MRRVAWVVVVVLAVAVAALAVPAWEPAVAQPATGSGPPSAGGKGTWVTDKLWNRKRLPS